MTKQDSKKNTADTVSNKIDAYWDQYKQSSSEASKIARQTALVEGAVFYVLYLGSGGTHKVLFCLFYIFLVLSFASDLIQYILTAYKYEQIAETLQTIQKKNPRNKNLVYELPNDFVYSLRVFYHAKLICLGIASITLIIMFVFFLQVNISSIHSSQTNNMSSNNILLRLSLLSTNEESTIEKINDL